MLIWALMIFPYIDRNKMKIKNANMNLDNDRFHVVNIYKGCYRSHDLL